MTIISLSEFRANIAKHLDKTEADRAELIVTRRNRQPVVVIPLSELEALRETLHLFSTPANAGRLLASIAELDAGQGSERDIRLP